MSRRFLLGFLSLRIVHNGQSQSSSGISCTTRAPLVSIKASIIALRMESFVSGDESRT
jgi:hypothetical protein